MPSPAIQSLTAANVGNASPGQRTFSGAQAAGNTNVICIKADGQFATPTTGLVTSVTQTGNTYAKQFFEGVPAGSAPAVWIFTCVGIAANSAGSVVTVNWTGPNSFFTLTGAEYAPTGAVRTANGSGQFGGTAARPATTLTGTVTGDLVVMCGLTNNASMGGAGAVGANTANVVQYSSGDQFVMQDGLSDGTGTMTVKCGALADDFWAVAAIAFIPSGGGGGGSVSDPPWGAAHRSRRNTLLRMSPERERVAYAGQAFTRKPAQRLFHAQP